MLVIPRRRERVKKVLFVYTANTCCSPMAQAIFDTLAEFQRRLTQSPINTVRYAKRGLRTCTLYPEQHKMAGP
jgi:hypothetical protein